MLAGSRYDLVERNNNIVLEYRKSEVIRIALPERIEGKGGQTVSTGLVVSKATHGLKNVQWEAPSLLAAGGKNYGAGQSVASDAPGLSGRQRQLLCDFSDCLR